MLKSAVIIFMTLLMSIAPAASQTISFEAGQKWTVKDGSMTIVIGVIEPFGSNRTAISVSVLNVPCPPQAGCTTTNVAHAPFDSQALSQSVDKLVDTHGSLAADFAQGYKNWKDAKGGIFTIPVSKLPDLLLQTLSSGTSLQNEPAQKQ